MPKLLNLFFRNKKILILGLFLALFFSFLPLQIINLNLNSTRAVTYNCEPSGSNYLCNGTLPDSACHNLETLTAPAGSTFTNCSVKCRDAGGESARLGSGTAPDPFLWHCCNLPIDTICHGDIVGDITLTAIPESDWIDLDAGNPDIPPPGNDFKWPWDTIGNAIQNLIQFLLGGVWVAALSIIAYLFLVLFGIIAGFSGPILEWTIRTTLSIPVVPGAPGVVNIVRDGWTFTRDLVNILFILILVFIGLATILRLKSYEAKKTLPLLVAVALLVNFSGVIVGVIVDISNLVTNFFISGINTWNFSFTNIYDAAFSLWRQLSGLITNMLADPSVYLASFVEPFGRMVVTAFFFLVLVFILNTIAFVFLLRTIYLWIIVILAPLAFASYILPATAGFWKWWWKNLIQWSIVGIPISFFLYLSTMVINAGNDMIGGFGAPGAASGWLGTLFVSLLSPLAVIILLFVGIGLSMNAVPAAAQQAIDFGKKTGFAAARISGTALGRRVSPAVEKWGQRLERSKFATDHKVWGAGPRWMGRAISMGAGEGSRAITALDNAEFEKGKKEGANKWSEDNFRIINEELLKPAPLRNWNRVAGVLAATRDNKDSDDIQKSLKEGILKNHAKKFKNIIDAGKRVGGPGYRSLIKSIYGSLMTNPEKYGHDAKFNQDKNGVVTYTGKDANILKGFYEEIPPKFNAEDFKENTMAPENYDPATPEGKFFLTEIVKNRGSDFLPQILRRPNREENINIYKYLQSKDDQWYIDNHAESVLRWSYSNASRNLGMGPIGKMNLDTIKKKVEERDSARRKTSGKPPLQPPTVPKPPINPQTTQSKTSSKQPSKPGNRRIKGT